MEKVSWNTVKKKQIGLEQIENEKHKSQLGLEPDFPGVATPQSSEWIIYIISYSYNPFTAPWGVIWIQQLPQAPILHSLVASSIININRNGLILTPDGHGTLLTAFSRSTNMWYNFFFYS